MKLNRFARNENHQVYFFENTEKFRQLFWNSSLALKFI